MDISMLYSVPLAAVTASVVITYYYYKNAFSYWRNRGLAGPRAYPFVGNFGQILINHKVAIEWMRKFGKVYGVYEGTKPALAVSDPVILQQICIKDFHVFPNHPDAEFNSRLARKFIFNADDDHWRNIRAILSPTFTSGKMRRMYKLLDVCVDNMLEALQERLGANPIVNLKDLFGLYTMDAIASCCYGLRLASYKGEASLTSAANRDEFVKLGLKLFDFKIWRLLIILSVHNRILRYFDFSFVSHKTEWAFARRVQQIIEKRRQSGKNFDDYLQTLIDAKSDAGISNGAPLNNSAFETTGDRKDFQDVARDKQRHDATSVGEEQEEGKPKWQSFNEKPLSEEEVLSSATFLLIVGLETTSSLLTHCVYALSFHQSIQERLHQTIKSLAKYDAQNKASFDHEAIISCEYLDAVICETLRKHPPAMGTDRVASEDYYLASHKILIPKGMKVIFTLKSIMMDEDLWSEPEIFDPDRFMPGQKEKIKPYSYCPFGIGPRHCLGMRFALTEAKLALARLLLEYRFEPAPGTVYPGEPKLAAGLNNLKRPDVTVIKR